MRTTYRMEMSDGQKIELTEISAGAAIMAALKRSPGKTVATCHSGNKLATSRAAAFIDYDVPKHVALTEKQAMAKTVTRRFTDETEAMFDDVAIKAESIRSKERFSHA